MAQPKQGPSGQDGRGRLPLRIAGWEETSAGGSFMPGGRERGGGVGEAAGRHRVIPHCRPARFSKLTVVTS